MTGSAQTPPPTGGKPRPGTLVALFGAGVVLFNAPLLRIWDNGGTVLGLPLLPVGLFAVWALLVVAIALASEG